ncbi:hypothetical protein ACFFH2_07035 [Enterococcus devriesei]|uniref:hypothetical protein n=1 Tax=Enterococcus devriesei TaxID=319970 RepID=UPI0009000F1B|nr:hypothetical protein [Enterococcus devriesei]
MQSLNGIVSSIKIIKYSERPLVYFKVNDQSCLIAAHSLNFLADVENGMRIAIAGEFNSRKQFVVKRYGVIGKTMIMRQVEMMTM